MHSVDYERPDPSTVPDGALELLTRVLAAPPHRFDAAHVQRLLALWPDYARVPGFRVVTARAEGRLVGVTWGWDTVIGSEHEPEMFGDLYRLIDRQPWADELVGTEIAELAVEEERRGRGIGSHIRDLLLDGGPGWLLARSGGPAEKVYGKLGWVKLGRVGGDVPLVAFRSP